MKVIIKETLLKTVESFATGRAAKQFKDKWKLRPKGGKCKIDISNFSDDALQKLHDHLGELAGKGDRSAALSRRMVGQWQEIKQNPRRAPGFFYFFSAFFSFGFLKQFRYS